MHACHGRFKPPSLDPDVCVHVVPGLVAVPWPSGTQRYIGGEGPFIWLFSGSGRIICRGAICLRLAEPSMCVCGGVNDGL